MVVSLIKILRLTHYSATPVREVEFRAQLGKMQGFKPRGLWVSVDDRGDGWADWCRSEAFSVQNLEHIHAVRLVANPNIAHLRSIPALMAFSDRFRVRDVEYWRGIDWEAVAQVYDGILIEPYTWPQVWGDNEAYHSLSHWYYGWDCASGCIWNPAVVASIELIEQPERVAA